MSVTFFNERRRRMQERAEKALQEAREALEVEEEASDDQSQPEGDEGAQEASEASEADQEQEAQDSEDTAPEPNLGSIEDADALRKVADSEGIEIPGTVSRPETLRRYIAEARGEGSEDS